MKVFLILIVLSFASAGIQAQPRNPELDAVPFPDENPLTESKRVLGKLLFWEEQLSSDNSVACGSCHQPGNGGADGRIGINPGPDRVFNTDDDVLGSVGIRLYDSDMNFVAHEDFGFNPQVTARAAPSILTAMFARDLFWDGRAREVFRDPLTNEIIISDGGALENQALGPIMNTAEMAKQGRTWAEVTAKLVSVQPMVMASNLPSDMANVLAAGEDYPTLFDQAFGDPEITPVRIAMAIATYERTLVPDQSPWDEFVRGNRNAMNAVQRSGWRLFQGSECSGCHRPPLFTDNRFDTIGLRPASEDIGRQAVSGNRRDLAAFKVPSLRNVGLRNTLTHVGWITDVSDAIDFYNSGTNDTGHTIFAGNLSNVRGRNFDDQDIAINEINFFGNDANARGLVAAFLSTALTDPRVANETFPFDRPELGNENRIISSAASASNPADNTLVPLVLRPDPARVPGTIDFNPANRPPREGNNQDGPGGNADRPPGPLRRQDGAGPGRFSNRPGPRLPL